jgi:hypothetical protein
MTLIAFLGQLISQARPTHAVSLLELVYTHWTKMEMVSCLSCDELESILIKQKLEFFS